LGLIDLFSANQNAEIVACILLSGEQDSEYVSYSCWLNNLPGSSTRNTQAVKNINCYVNKVDEEENDVAEGAVIPEEYNNASVSFVYEFYIRYPAIRYLVTGMLVIGSDQTRAAAD